VRESFLEGLLVAAIGAGLAFGANRLSPRGLELSKNYFPATRSGLTAPVTSPQPTNAAAASTNTPAERLTARLREQGLQFADSNLVSQFFNDPRRGQDWVIFVDARDDEHYTAGHIPGAFHFDRFYPEKYLSNVVQVCLSAQRIVFYCNGGDCDDSEHAAIILRDSMGIPQEKVFVYGGGLAEWTTNGLPIELGARNSGVLTNVNRSATSGHGEGPNR
jgi:rhodanese-related sulfurtransferase